MTGRRVRAGNGQREQVVQRLNQALAEGRVGLTEFEERAAAAMYAQWADELSQFTADLPRRATAGQRVAVVERLGEAAAQGYLRFPEFEERSIAVNQTVWADELSEFTRDLPAAFQLRAAPIAVELTRRSFLQKHSLAAGIAAILVILGLGISIPLLLTKDDDVPSAVVPDPIPPSAVVSVSPPPSSPAAAAPASKAIQPSAPRITIACSVGESGDKKTFSSLKKAWAENGGTYFCEATVPESHRLTKLERSAVAIDQRIGNGESNIESLESLLSLCADTMQFEFNYDDITDAKPEPRPYTVDDYKKFDPDRLEAMFKLCPATPTARRIREAIYSR